MNVEEKAKAYDDIRNATKNHLLALTAQINAITVDTMKKAKACYFDEVIQDLEKIHTLLEKELSSFLYRIVDYL